MARINALGCLLLFLIIRIKFWHVIHHSRIRLKLRDCHSDGEFFELVAPAAVLALIAQYNLLVFKVFIWFLTARGVGNNEV